MANDLTLILGDRDATQLVSTVTLSGNYKQCARTLAMSLAVSSLDTFIPTINYDLGTHVGLYVDGKLKFDGWGVTSTEDTASNTVDLTCYDRGFYLRRNETIRAVRNQTPEAVTKSLCEEFGIECGDIEITGVALTRNFLPSSGGANSLYSIIGTLYTMASKITGDKYIVRFEGEKLCVRKKELTEYSIRLAPGIGLLTAKSTQSYENMVNQVLVYDSNDKLIMQKTDSELKDAYGLLQSVIKAGNDNNPTELAEAELRDNALTQKITVTNIGNIDCLTGNTVIINEPQTGLNGVFWIDEDYHYWRKGIYTNKLVLNYQCLMNEVTVGSEG